jgi:hypothetical protein
MNHRLGKPLQYPVPLVMGLAWGEHRSVSPYVNFSLLGLKVAWLMWLDFTKRGLSSYIFD